MLFVPLDPVIVKTHQPLGPHSYLKKTPIALNWVKTAVVGKHAILAWLPQVDMRTILILWRMHLPVDLCKLSCMVYKYSSKGKKARFYTARRRSHANTHINDIKPWTWVSCAYALRTLPFSYHSCSMHEWILHPNYTCTKPNCTVIK